MLDLLLLFESLPTPAPSAEEGQSFAAQPIPGYECHRLARDSRGAPSLLISIGSTPGRPPAPLVLEHMTVLHRAICDIVRLDGESERNEFTVVRCTGQDAALHHYFLRIAGGVVASLGNAPSWADVSRILDGLVELFRAMSQPGRKPIQGLWAELFLIAKARRAEKLVRAWHATPEDRYDFCAGSQRIEVKSSANRVRRHHFSLEQVLPPANTTLLIASLFVERAGNGTSLFDLVEQIRSKISRRPDLLLHMDRVVGLTLGDSWRFALEERFDRELAAASLTFFESGTVPRVNANLPPGVSDVHFMADLASSPPADLDRYRVQGELFGAALGR